MDKKLDPAVEVSSGTPHTSIFHYGYSLETVGLILLCMNLFFIIAAMDVDANWKMGKFVHQVLEPLVGSIGIIIIPAASIALSASFLYRRKNRLLNGISQYSLFLCFIILPIVNLIIRMRLGEFYHPSDDLLVGVYGALVGSLVKTLFGPGLGIVAIIVFAILAIPPVSGYSSGEIVLSFAYFLKNLKFRIKSCFPLKDDFIRGLISDVFAEDDAPSKCVEQAVSEPKVKREKKSKASSRNQNNAQFDDSEEPQLELNFHRMLRESGQYKFPPIDLLNPPGMAMAEDDKKEIAFLIEKTLTSYGVDAKVEGIIVGPVIIRCEIRPATGVRVNAIRSLKNEIAMALSARSLRIEAPIPGRDVIGIEFPNSRKRIVTLREILESDEFKRSKSLLTVCIGQDLAGQPIIADLARMPHLLAAGQTGAGKSVCLNSIVISLLYNTAPDEVKIILIDPKRVEMNLYENLPHLLVPVVQEWNDAKNALIWVAKEMTSRLERLKDTRCRDIATFNRKRPDGEFMPYIIIVIDEFATLMDLAPGREVERLINHLARLARASGIHLILATQRPDVKVITGSIKANIPARIAFSVPSMVDSRTILDRGGADLLLGEGDMLYRGPLDGAPKRAQGSYVSDDEIERVVDFVMKQIKPEFRTEILTHQGEVDDLQGLTPLDDVEKADSDDDDEGDDELYLAEATRIVKQKKRVSASLLQRELRIGYNRASRIIDLMEQRGIISGWDGHHPRRLIDDDDDDLMGLVV